MERTQTLVALSNLIVNFSIDDDQMATMPIAALQGLLTLLVEDVFDEDWYLQANPDVAELVENGALRSGLHHYLASGIFEGRVPCDVNLDEMDYLFRHPDVKAAITRGDFSNGKDHFVQSGFREGRAFYLA